MNCYVSLLLALLAAALASCATLGRFRADPWTVRTAEIEEQSRQMVEIDTFVVYMPIVGHWPKILPDENVYTEDELDTFLAAVRKSGGSTTSAPSAIVQQGTPLIHSKSSIQRFAGAGGDADLLSIETTATINDSESVDIRWKLSHLGTPDAGVPNILAAERVSIPLNSFAHAGGLIVYAAGDEDPMELTVFTRVSRPYPPAVRPSWHRSL
ncbi:hypothetical protein BH23VER1_BH23VER1_30330 [soil metagenome]